MAARLVAAVDIGATKTLVTVRSVTELADGWTAGPIARIETERDAATLSDWIAEQVHELARERGGPVVAVGVAAPGPLDARTGVITRSSNLDWSDLPLASMLRDRLDAPVHLEDDANVAALGEWCFGAGRGRDPVAYLTVSSGIGGAIVVGGDIVRGSSGNAGEVGHLRVSNGGPRCACGRRGDVEAYAGGAAIARRARTVWPRASDDVGHDSPRTPEAVFRAARAGDPDAAEIVEDAAEALAVAMAALTASLDPEVIVVGGSIGLSQPRLVRRATTLARKSVLAELGRSMQVLPAELGTESVVAGAAYLASRHHGGA